MVWGVETRLRDTKIRNLLNITEFILFFPLIEKKQNKNNILKCILLHILA